MESERERERETRIKHFNGRKKERKKERKKFVDTI